MGGATTITFGMGLSFTDGDASAIRELARRAIDPASDLLLMYDQLADRIELLVRLIQPTAGNPDATRPYGRFGDDDRITDAELADIDQGLATGPLETLGYNPVIIRRIIATLRAERAGYFDEPGA